MADEPCEWNFGEPEATGLVLRDYQIKAKEAVAAGWGQYSRQLLDMATGTGKCLGRGVPVMKYDGAVVAVEDVQQGDWLMGPDSMPRLVLSTCTGTEMLYRVTPTKGDAYVVNEGHILSLKMTTGRKRLAVGGRMVDPGSIANVPVLEYLGASGTFKHCAKGWRAAVDFQPTSLHRHMPPYMLGLWLGDGTAEQFSISKPDVEVEKSVRDYAESLGLFVTTNGDSCPTHHVVGYLRGSGGGGANLATRALRELGVLENKHIPHAYKTASRLDRLELLAGILDADGHLTKGCYDYITKDRALSEDVAFVARSLGFAAFPYPCKKGCQNGFVGDYFRMNISGPLSVVPCRIPRRKAVSRLQDKNVLVTGITIEPIGVGDYFGFQINGPDHLFLLGDFTVTHNTTLFAAIAAEEWAAGRRTLVLENRDALVKQTAKRITEETGLDAEIEMAGEHAGPFAPVVVASVPTLCRDNRLTGFADDHFGLVVQDEAHHSLSKSFSKVAFYFHYGCASLAENWNAPPDGTYAYKARILGVTATPELGGSRQLGELYQGDKPAYTYQLWEAIRDGWLVQPTAHLEPLAVDFKGLRATRTAHGSDYNPTQVGERMVPVIDALAKLIVRVASDRKTMAFMPSVKTAAMLAAAINAHGLRAVFVSGECLDRDSKTEDFVEHGPGIVLTTSAMYTEGFDVPDVDCVFAGITKSVSYYRQKIGRATRPLKGIVNERMTAEERRAAIAASAKKDFLIIDPFFKCKDIDLCDVYFLYSEEPEVREKMKDAGLPSVEKAEKAERDFIKSLEKEARKHQRKATQVLNPLLWSVSLGDEKLATWAPSSPRDLRPVTPGQAELLRRHHVDLTKITCFGLAQRLIGTIMQRHQLGLAKVGQLNLLHQLCIPDHLVSTLTEKEASDLIDATLKQKRGA